jgi:hypothetical protein
MSLEAAIEKLTAAVEANTAALKAGGGGKASAASAADKAIEAEAKRATGAKAAAKPASKKVTLDTIKERFGSYLGVEDKAERKTRIGHVQAIVDHFGVSKASELEEENWAEALAFLKQYEDGEEPDFGGDDDGDDDGDGALV